MQTETLSLNGYRDFATAHRMATKRVSALVRSRADQETIKAARDYRDGLAREMAARAGVVLK